MPALLAASATGTLADVHREPAAQSPRLGQLVLILVLGPLMLDLAATLAPRRQRRVELLIDFPGRLTVPMPAVLIPATTTRPARLGLRLPARERRRLTLGRPARLLQLALQLPDLARSRTFSPESRTTRPTSARSPPPAPSTAPPNAPAHPPTRPGAPQPATQSRQPPPPTFAAGYITLLNPLTQYIGQRRRAQKCGDFLWLRMSRLRPMPPGKRGNTSLDTTG